MNAPHIVTRAEYSAPNKNDKPVELNELTCKTRIVERSDGSHHLLHARAKAAYARRAVFLHVCKREEKRV